MSNPLVSVIIPTFNATGRLQKAIDSVLKQTYRNFEIIVVDDNDEGSDGRKKTESIMRRYDGKGMIKYLKHEHNRNGSAARNTGLNVSSGDYLAFLDDDDEYYPARLEMCVQALNDNPDYDAVYTNVDIYHNDYYVRTHCAVFSGNVWKELLLDDCLLGTGSNLFFRRCCLETVQCFDESFMRYQDVEFMLRVLQKHKLLSLNETLVKKNHTGKSILVYEKYKENKTMVFNKFKNLIGFLNDKEKKAFYGHHYEQLFNAALKTKKNQAIKCEYRNLLKYKKPTVKLWMKYRFPGLYMKFYNIKRLK